MYVNLVEFMAYLIMNCIITAALKTHLILKILSEIHSVTLFRVICRLINKESMTNDIDARMNSVSHDVKINIWTNGRDSVS